MANRRTFCPEDGHACYTPEGPEPEGFRCANYGLCKSFEPTPPNKPNSSPEMTEVARIARVICEASGNDPDRLTYHTVEPGVQEPYGPAWCHYEPEAIAAIQALSTKNELPSEIVGLLCRVRTLLLCSRADTDSTMRPLYMLGERDELIAAIDAALNPKDTDTTPLVTGRE